MLKEIKPPTLKDMGYEPSTIICPYCNIALFRGSVPCPDGKPGCLVLHYGLKCPKCGKNYTGI